MSTESDPVHPTFELPEHRNPPSAARLAAEAFFQQPPAEDAPTTPEVMVKRARAQPTAALEDEAGSTQAAPRAPRVFRMQSSTLPELALAAPAAETAALGDDAPLGAQRASGEAVAPARRPRRTRRQLHGEVTITHPQVVDDAVEPSVESRRWPRYPALLRELRALQAQAEQARLRERRAAIAWIRQAMADHALSADDLGDVV